MLSNLLPIGIWVYAIAMSSFLLWASFSKKFKRRVVTASRSMTYSNLNGAERLITLYGHPNKQITISYRLKLKSGNSTLAVHADDGNTVWKRNFDKDDEGVIELHPTRETTYRFIITGQNAKLSIAFKTTGAGTDASWSNY